MSEYTVSTDRTGGNIPEGVHLFRVTESEDKDGPSAPYWNFTMECANGPFEGSMIWAIISHSQAARFRMEEWLDAFQVPEGLEVDGDYFIGRTCRVKIKHEEYDGKVRPKPDSYLPDTSSKATAKVTTKARKGKAAKKSDATEQSEAPTLPEDTTKGTTKYKKAF